MPHRLVMRPAAQRQLDRIRGVPLAALRGVMLGLADQPRPNGATKLVDSSNLWRLRIRVDGQSWRVIYEIDDAKLVVRITRIARRGGRG